MNEMKKITRKGFDEIFEKLRMNYEYGKSKKIELLQEKKKILREIKAKKGYTKEGKPVSSFRKKHKTRLTENQQIKKLEILNEIEKSKALKQENNKKDIIKYFDNESKFIIIFSETQNLILKKLFLKDTTRKEFVNDLGIARTTIYDNLNKLQKARIIRKYTINEGYKGRPLVYWTYMKGSIEKYLKNTFGVDF